MDGVQVPLVSVAIEDPLMYEKIQKTGEQTDRLIMRKRRVVEQCRLYLRNVLFSSDK